MLRLLSFALLCFSVKMKICYSVLSHWPISCHKPSFKSAVTYELFFQQETASDLNSHSPEKNPLRVVIVIRESRSHTVADACRNWLLQKISKSFRCMLCLSLRTVAMTLRVLRSVTTLLVMLLFTVFPSVLWRFPSVLWRFPSVLWRCWLGGRKGIRPVKNWVVGCWRGYLSAARCRLAYGPADATATHCLLLQ